MEWQLNEFNFYSNQHRNGTFKKTPAAQFVGFLDMCTEAWRQRIRRVTLRSQSYAMEACQNNPLLMADLHLVTHTCERYPSMTVQWHLELLPHACSRSSLVSFLHNDFIFAEVKSRGLRIEPHLERLEVQAIGAYLALYHKFWCTKDNGQGHSLECESMIRAKNFRTAPFNERFTESAFENLVVFKAGEADEDVENKTVDEKRLALTKGW